MSEETDLLTLPIERIIYSLSPDHLSNLQRLRTKVINEVSQVDDRDKILTKLDYAEKRITQPLETSLKLMYILIPFGITSSFTKNETSEIQKFMDLGFVQKSKSYYRYSIAGVLLYILGGSVAFLLTS